MNCVPSYIPYRILFDSLHHTIGFCYMDPSPISTIRIRQILDLNYFDKLKLHTNFLPPGASTSENIKLNFNLKLIFPQIKINEFRGKYFQNLFSAHRKTRKRFSPL